jgi:hypothetical protein
MGEIVPGEIIGRSVAALSMGDNANGGDLDRQPGERIQ